MPMQLFGVGKAALYGFLSSLVDLFALLGVTMTVDRLFMILPDMPGNHLGEVC
jgi:hypothetical protein